MSLSELLTQIVELLDGLGIPYMITGSLAASYHGAPRATQDVDLVVEVELHQIEPLGEAARERGWYVSEDAARDAVQERSQFNVIDPETGWKIDLIVRKDRPFSREEFGRRHVVQALGHSLFMVTPEDLVIAKLEWARIGESERQLRDVRNILDVQGDRLDKAHVDRWTGRLGLGEAWRAISEEEA